MIDHAQRRLPDRQIFTFLSWENRPTNKVMACIGLHYKCPFGGYRQFHHNETPLPSIDTKATTVKSNFTGDISGTYASEITASGDLLDFTALLKPLLPFENRLLNDPQSGILFNFEEYLALVNWSGRIIRSDKQGHIDNALPPILDRLKITADQWRINTTQFEAIYPKRFNQLKTQLDTG